MDTNDFRELLNSVYYQKMAVPKKIKINQGYLTKLIDEGVFDLETDSTLVRFNGIPVEYDDSIATFEFVYK